MYLKKIEQVKSETRSNFSKEELSMGEREQTRSSGVTPAEAEHERKRCCFRGHCAFRAGSMEAEVCAGCRCHLASTVLAPWRALCDMPLSTC